MPEGGILEIGTKWAFKHVPNQRKKNVAIVIRDTGDGFDPIAPSQVVHPFFYDKGAGVGSRVGYRKADCGSASRQDYWEKSPGKRSGDCYHASHGFKTLTINCIN